MIDFRPSGNNGEIMTPDMNEIFSNGTESNRQSIIKTWLSVQKLVYFVGYSLVGCLQSPQEYFAHMERSPL